MYLANPVIEIEDNTPTTPVVTDITELCSSCVLNLQKPQVSGQNTYGVEAQRRELKGLWDGGVTVNFHHDYSALGISKVLWLMLQDNAPWTMRIRPHDAAISATNPEWVIPVSLSEMPAIEGDPGEIAASSVTFELAGVPTQNTTP